MTSLKTDKPVGIVNASYFHENFSLTTYHPSSKLADIIEHYWLISWQLPNEVEHAQSVIPHPNTHLTFLQGNSHVQGICKQKYTHTLSDHGNLVGIKFKPAGFYPFAKAADVAMSQITNAIHQIETFFPALADSNTLEEQVLATEDEIDKLSLLETALFNNIPEYDQKVVLTNNIVATISTDKNIFAVEDICQTFNIEARSLQRLFKQYIGINAKWVINRYRMHEALTLIENKQEVDLTTLALNLGYFDQAHFIKDFKQLMGITPKQHQATVT